VGTDIDPSNFPDNLPAGQMYQVQDIHKPWPVEWKDSFDFVHQRLGLAGAGPSAQQIVNNLAALVKPGGWIQLIEATNNLPEENGPAMHNFVTVMKSVFMTFGTSLKLGDELPDILKAAGLEDVQDRIVSTKLGATNPNAHLAKQGIYSTTVGANGLAKFGSSEYSHRQSTAHSVERFDRSALT